MHLSLCIDFLDLLGYIYICTLHIPFVDQMSKERSRNVPTNTSTLTLLLMAIAGGLIALSLQPLVLLFYSRLGVPTMPLFYQQSSNEMALEQMTSTIATTVAPITTTISIIKSTLENNDLATDEEPLLLKDKPLTITISESTTVKSIVNEKSKQSKSSHTRTVDKSEEEMSQPVKLKKTNQQPEIIDVTGRNKQIPDEVKNFKSTRISTLT